MSPPPHPLLPELERDPRLPSLVEHLSHVLEEEARRRQAFYDWLDEDKKAEFIEGEVVVHSPAKWQHNDARRLISRVLDAFVELHRLGAVDVENNLIRLTRNDYEPDICFWPTEVYETFQPDQMHFPAPDLIVEVLSPSTEANDRGIKFQDYALHNVREYWIVDPDAQIIEQYLLDDAGTYRLETRTGDGTIRSRVLEGLAFPARAAFDAEQNRATVASLIAR